MDDEKFKLNRTNIILLIVDILIFILVIISIVLLVDSFKTEQELPDLLVTKEKTSTSNTTTTTEYVPPTTTTTTRRNLTSPYYDVNVDSILSDAIVTKKDLKKEEALSVMTILYETVDKIFNTKDNSLLDIATTLDYAKESENDVIVFEDKRYGIIYNGEVLLKKCFTYQFLNNEIGKYKYFQKRLFLKRGNLYYRLEDMLGNVQIMDLNITVSRFSDNEIHANLRFYKSNYKELGYTSPFYQVVVLKAKYEAGRWKMDSIDYPLAD